MSCPPSSSASDHAPRLDPSNVAEKPSADQRETSVDGIGWNGPDDPENPMNWPEWRKTTTILLVGIMGFSTPFASSVPAPGISQITDEFHSTSGVLAGFVVSIYVLGTAIGPIVFAPASELWGRSIILHTCNVWFVASTIGCALSTSLGMLLAFRFLAGCAGAAPLTVGGGTIADIIPIQQRGKYVAIFSAGGLVGPILGPVVGGYLVEGLGWRWAFWLVLIISGVITVSAFLFLRETYAPALLRTKALRVRGDLGHINIERESSRSALKGEIFLRAFTRPTKIFIKSPIAFLLAIYQALLWGYTYLLFTTFPQIFMGQYHFSIGASGLLYIGLGIGTASAMLINARLSDKILLADAKKHDTEPRPEGRLILMVFAAPLIPIGLFWYGWSAEAQVHWIVSTLGTVVLGAGILGTSLPGNLYMIDAFTQYAASALAASFFLRSIAGGLLPLAGQPLFSALGVGWGASVLAFVAVPMCIIPVLLFRYGERLRTSYPVVL